MYTAEALANLDELLQAHGEVAISYRMIEELYFVTLGDGQRFEMPSLADAINKAFEEGIEE